MFKNGVCGNHSIKKVQKWSFNIAQMQRPFIGLRGQIKNASTSENELYGIQKLS